MTYSANSPAAALSRDLVRPVDGFLHADSTVEPSIGARPERAERRIRTRHEKLACDLNAAALAPFYVFGIWARVALGWDAAGGHEEVGSPDLQVPSDAGHC